MSTKQVLIRRRPCLTNDLKFGDDDSSDDNLPYPKPLTRASFLTPDFDPTTFLSTLRNRHQTLEDLRTELRTRSQDLTKELLDLVNEDYQDFLSLGSSLRGGDEKVEEVRLGLLGFKREVEALRGKVDGRRKEVEELVGERKRIRENVQLGRRLLEIDRKIGDLEGSLMLASTGPGEAVINAEGMGLSESDEDSGEEVESNGIGILRLQRHVEQYLYIKGLVARTGPEHPFLVKQEERVLRLKQTVLLDLNSALKQAVAGGEDLREDLLKLLGIYRQMGEASEAMQVLKELKR